MGIKRNCILAVLLLGLSAFLWWQASLIPSATSDLAVVDAAFFPQIIAILLTILTLFVLWQERTDDQQRIPFFPTLAFRKVLLFIGLMMAAAMGFQLIGFEPVSLIFLALTMWILGMRSIPLLCILPPVVTGIIYFIFIKIMYVPIPSITRLF